MKSLEFESFNRNSCLLERGDDLDIAPFYFSVDVINACVDVTEKMYDISMIEAEDILSTVLKLVDDTIMQLTEMKKGYSRAYTAMQQKEADNGEQSETCEPAES